MPDRDRTCPSYGRPGEVTEEWVRRQADQTGSSREEILSFARFEFPEVPIEDQQAILERMIQTASVDGYFVTYRTDTTAQLAKKKSCRPPNTTMESSSQPLL